MINGAVFDLDGVIIDSHPLHKQAWRAFLASVGREVSESDLDFILEGRRRHDILIHFLGELSDSQIQEYGTKKDEFFREVCAVLEPLAGSVEFIKKLDTAGICMAVATSASRQRTRWTLQELHISQYFDVVVTGDDVAQSKPDPAIYRLAAEYMAISPGCLFAIEDSVCGVRSAKSAGLRCVGIAPADKADSLIQAGADRVVPNLTELSVRDLEEVFNA
jgi:beta-phosphoglucomutase